MQNQLKPGAVPPIGVIGGTGIYALGESLEGMTTLDLDTPFGKPSCPLVRGKVRGAEGREVVFLARHGTGHVFSPTEVPYRANIWAMKSIGVRTIISFSAVGSLKEEHRPTDMVLPTQFIDRTYARKATFFADGIVAHVSFANPVCEELARAIADSGTTLSPPVTIKLGGTYVCMEGPAFSTRAESELYRSWHADLIGMTNLTEAKLAREAEIAYATVALVTDYDCWRESEEAVTAEAVGKTMKANAANAIRLIEAAIRRVDPMADWPAHHSLDGAITTHHDHISKEAKARLAPILARFKL